MALTPRKIYDAVGVAYEVAVEPFGATKGDGQAVVLYDSSGSPVVPLTSTDISGLATEATLASIKDTDGIKKITDPVTADPGTGWASAVANGDDLTDSQGPVLKISNGSNQATDLLQPITASELTTAALATAAKQDTALIELKIANGSYAMQVDDAGGGVTYQGWAVPGTAVATAGWRIRRITATGDDYSIDWQDGNANFDNKWTERVSAANYS